MKKRLLPTMSKRIVCMLLALVVGSSTCIAYAVSEETQNQIDQTKKEKEDAEKAKSDAEKAKNDLNNAKAETQSYLKNLEKQTGSLNEQISVLNNDIKDKEAEVENKQAEVEAAQAELDKQYEDMKKRIQYMYENGQDSMAASVTLYLTAALSGGMSEMLNQMEFSADVMSYDRQRLQDFQESKAALEEQYAQLSDEKEALDLMKQETEKKKQQVASQQKAAGSKLSSYNDMIAQKEGEISDMNELVKQKTQLLNELIAKAAAEEKAARIKAAQEAAADMEGVTIIAGDPKISRGEISLSDYEMLLLATMIYCEAGNQGSEGQLAVGYVIMNRVRSALYPNSLESVLRQSRQFEPAGSGRFDLVLQAEQDDDIPNIVTESCWKAAQAVVNGTSNVGDCLFFRTWAPVPSLITNLEAGGVPYYIIKDHIFYYYWTSYSKEE